MCCTCNNDMWFIVLILNCLYLWELIIKYLWSWFSCFFIFIFCKTKIVSTRSYFYVMFWISDGGCEQQGLVVAAIVVTWWFLILQKTANKCGRCCCSCGCKDLKNLDAIAAIVVADHNLKPWLWMVKFEHSGCWHLR